MSRWLLAAILAATLLSSIATMASATTLPGPNGQLVFTSGRGGAAGNDDGARLWRVSATGGTALAVPTTAGGRHSHPNWSPDRTRIAYAKSDTGAGPRDIWVYNLVTGSDTRITDTDDPVDEDRPSWSPDGTKVAYGRRDAAAGESDIYVYTVGGAINSGVNLNNSAASEDRPVWSPDGQSIYYAVDTAAPFTDDNNIVRIPAGGGAATNVVAGAGINEWQPAISPDGSKLCYSRGGMANSGAGGVDVWTGNTGGVNSGLAAFKDSTVSGEFNCVWSPDGTRIAYVDGVFSGGDLRSDNLAENSILTLASSPVGDAHFDGNPDWTQNPAPSCSNGAASVAFNSFVSINLSCSDPADPPEEEPTALDAELVAPPGNGVLGEISDTNQVIYTPNVNFQGTDTFTIKTNDGTSDSPAATITVRVDGPVGNPPGTAARVEALSVSPKRWKRGRGLPTVSQAPTGTRVGVRLSAAGRVRLTFLRARPGRRVNGRCVKPTRRNSARRRCTRYVSAGTYAFDGKQGANSIRFQGRLSRRKTLPLGKYRLSARVTANGQTSAARTVSFRIVRR